MFDDHDHRTLHELEWNLSMEDPEFVARFDRGQEQLAAEPHRRRGNRIALSVALVAGALLLLLGTPGGALAAMSTTGLVWLAWRYPNVFGSSPS